MEARFTTQPKLNLLHFMPTKNLSFAVFKLVGVLATLAAGVGEARAAVTVQTLNLTSGGGAEGIGFGYNFSTFAISNTGEQTGSVMARSAFDPFDNMFFGLSYLNGDYVGGSFQAKVSATSVSFGATIDSSVTWSSRIDLSQGLGDTFYGIRFDNGGGSFSYGWVKLSTPGNTVVLGSAGVEQALNTAISAGSFTSSIPEPGSAAALAGLAAVALTASRRKRSAV
jgi:hypothetical protein